MNVDKVYGTRDFDNKIKVRDWGSLWGGGGRPSKSDLQPVRGEGYEPTTIVIVEPI